MAHFAKVSEENIVEDVIVVPDEQEHRGSEYLNELGFEGNWIQCSYNNRIRNKYPAKGFLYIPHLDVFVVNPPFDSWGLNEDTLEFEAPVPKPEYDKETHQAYWNEDLGQWEISEIVEITDEEE